MEKTKNGAVCTQKHEADISLQVKISLCSEISMHRENFAILAKISLLLRKFCYVAKFC